MAKKTAVKKTLEKKSVATAKIIAKTATKAAGKAVAKGLEHSLVGKKAPAFELPATGGQTVSLKGLAGKKVVLYFYPKDATPGCTIEGHEFTRLKKQFEKKNTVVFGISRDSVKSHEKFKEKECYAIDLISDEKSELCNAFDVIKEKNMYGKKVMGIERSTFVIDEKGVVVNEWRKVKVEGHAEEVLNSLK